MSVQSLVRNEDQTCVYRSTNGSGVRVLWEVTSACNLECDFCLVEKKHRHIPLDRALDIARDLIECGVEKFLISGGEPLLYPWIEPLLEYLVERGVLIKLLTNGTLDKPAVWELIRTHRSLEVSLSLPSVDEVTADGIFRKPGSFRRLLATIDQLPLERLNVIAAYSTLNLESIERVIDWVAARGIPCLSITNVFKDPTSPARFVDNCCVYRADSQSVANLFSLIQLKRQQYRGRLVIRTTQFHGEAGETCGAGRSVLYLDCTGCLLPCTLTDNRMYREVVRGMSITDAVEYYHRTLPPIPASSCVQLLRGGGTLTPSRPSPSIQLGGAGGRT
jgi:MoaA/NifB/PqqE/SkfB family radical SAM enzyme